MFIVPPATAKTSYYQNTFTRGLWSSAFHALQDVVNLEPDELCQRIGTFGNAEVNQIGGSDCISDFTREYGDRAGDALIHELASMDRGDRGNSRLIARHSNGNSAMEYIHIQEIRKEQDDVVVLIAGKFVDTQEFISDRPPGDEGQAAGTQDPNLGNLIAVMRSAKRVVVRRDGEDSVVVGYSRLAGPIIRNDWFILIPV